MSGTWRPKAAGRKLSARWRGYATSPRRALSTGDRPFSAGALLNTFGDNWRHRIKIEKKLESMPPEMLPLCVAGANARPPEDCGGVYGYYDFVAAVSDPKHPEHAHMTEWIGRPWDVTAFDLERANSRLQEIKL